MAEATLLQAFITAGADLTRFALELNVSELLVAGAVLYGGHRVYQRTYGDDE